jgi:hypothetical protein
MDFTIIMGFAFASTGITYGTLRDRRRGNVLYFIGVLMLISPLFI